MINYRPLRFLPLAGLLLGLSCSSPLDPPAAANTADLPPSPLSAPASIGAEVPASGSGDPEEIKAIMAQIAAARRDIRSYRMRIKWQTRRFAETPVNGPLPAGVVVTEGEGVWIEEGEKWRVHHSRRNERPELILSRELPLDTPPRSGFLPNDFQYWVAFDGDEYAKRSTQGGGDYLTYYPGPVVRTGEQVQVGQELYPFPLKWGFGFGTYIDEFYRNTLARVKVCPIWDIERFESEDGPRIQMTVYQTKKGRSGHALELIVDPERDFQLVHVLAWESSGGKLLEEQQRVLQQLTDRRWFPLRITVRLLDEYTEWEFSDVEFNVSLDPSTFSFHSFESGHVTVMQRRNLDGTDTTFLLRGGQWVPVSMVPVSDRPRNMRSPKGGHPVVLNK